MNANEPVGTLRALWRFPVKSMLGEELEAVDLSVGGIIGDRAYAIRPAPNRGRDAEHRGLP